MSDASPSPPPTRAPLWRRPATPAGWALTGVLVLAILFGAAALVVRYGALLPASRGLIESAAAGLRLGSLGRLTVEGLDGDVWRDFTIRRLTVSDARGAWLQADRLRVRWSSSALLTRRLQVDSAIAEHVTVLRRPNLAPAGPSSGGSPVELDLRELRLRLETLPAFSLQRGLFAVTAKLRLQRGDRGARGALKAQSLLHAGDSLNLGFDVEQDRALLVDADAVEGTGGAMAGALGLPTGQPLSIAAHASGSIASGRLDARVTTGRQTPLDAHGAWTPAGGAVAGRVSLAASTLTRPWLRGLGPDLVLALASRAAPKGLHSLGVAARSQNLTLDASGLADLGTLSSAQGLRLAVATADLSRLLPGSGVGGGRLKGRLSGSALAWRFAGALAIERLSAGDVRIARVTGPITLIGHGEEIDVQAQLAGAGVTGAHLAALIGPTPRASFDLLRLADGRLLLRRADAAGAGFKLSGAGHRSLLGDIGMEGRLDMSNLAMLRPGAGGALELTWSGAQASPRAPWRMSVEGHGRDARSGLAELDRLLGPRPALTVKADYAGGALSVSQAALEGEKAAIRGAGKLDARGSLALTTEWRAEGPFRVGPVQIGGKASGKGAITGSLSAPRADLTADFAAIDIPDLPLTAAHLHLSFLKGPDGLDGVILLRGDSAYGPARAASGFRFVKGGVDLANIDADAGGVKASGALSLRGVEPSTADLRLAIGPGAVLTQGQIAGTVKLVDGAAPSAVIELQASGAALRGSGLSFRTARLSASGPLAQLPFQASANGQTVQGPLSFTGSGVYRQAGGVRQVAFNGSGRFRQVDVRTLEPLTARISGQDQSIRARLALGGGRLDFDSRQTGQDLTATAALQGVDLKALDPDFAGKLDADVTLQGRGGRLDGALTAKLAGARSVDAAQDAALGGVVKATLKNGRIDLDAQVSGAGGLKASLSAVLPAEASAAPLRIAIARDRPIQGRFVADGEIKPLWDLAYGSERELAGQAHLAGTLGGSLNDPQFTGQAQVANGRFDDYATGLRLNALALNADLGRDQVALRTLTAKDDKGGTVSGSGSVSLIRGGASNLKLALSRFRVIDNDTAEAEATGQALVTRGADGKVAISGALELDHAQINADARLRPSVVAMDVIEKNRPARLQQEDAQAPARGPPVTVDVRLHAASGVFVKGRGLNAELSLDAHVSGQLSSPTLTGDAQVVQGSYDFAGKRFEFDDQGRITLGEAPDQIRLDLSASWEAPSLTATIRIRGTAAKPQITLTSSPGLPQDEILSQVLFGASASQLSGAQTAQVASTVTSLATGGGFDVLGSLRQIAGLDRLALAGDQASGTSIAGGKYIGNNVYLEIVGGGRQGPSAEVDWRIRKGLSIISQIGGEYGAKLSVRWTHDIGKPPKPPARPKGAG